MNLRIALHRKTYPLKQRCQRIRGLETEWIEAGSSNRREILLFLHGFPDDANVWREQIRHFQNRYLVIAPMLRGVGGSEKPQDATRYGLNAVSLDLLEILKRVDPSEKKRVVLVGHDLGSLYAWHLAPLLGKRMKGLVILNGGHPLIAWERKTNPRQLFKSWYIYFFLLPLLPEWTLKIVGKVLLRRIKIQNGVPSRLAGDALDFSPHAVKQYREIAKSLPEYCFQGHRFKIQAPVLSISSLDDAFIEPANLQEMSLVAQKPTVRHIEGRHWAQIENPARVNGLMDKFLSEECAA